jgi:hypothetical protein
MPESPVRTFIPHVLDLKYVVKLLMGFLEALLIITQIISAWRCFDPFLTNKEAV